VIPDNQNIAVVGIGAGGSSLADMLARYGFKKLTLIDPDGLSRENVKRHILTRTSVGNFKVVGMENHLLMASEKGTIIIQIQPFDPKMFSEPPDIIACCADSDACCQLVNQYCVENGIPCVFGGVHGAAETAEIITYVPGLPCYACYEREGPEPEPSQEKYTDPDYDGTKMPHQEALWCDVLMAASIQFRAILAVLGSTFQLHEIVWNGCTKGQQRADERAKQTRLQAISPLILASLRSPYGAEIIRQEAGCAACGNDFSRLEK